MSRRARPRRRAVPRKAPPGPLRMLGGALAAIAAFAVVAIAWVMWTYGGPGPQAREGEVTTVVLPRGSGLSTIAGDLADAGVIRSRGLFMAAARLGGAAGSLKAGEYEFRSGTSMARVLRDIQAGRVVRHLVTVPEGWTSEMAWEAVHKAPVLTGEAPVPAEGTLLPDTYQVQRGDSRSTVIQRMAEAQDKLMADLWPKRQPGLPFDTPQEALTLASIVEKETGIAAERPRIAAVFVNRLRSGMRLESDPTIIYGVSKGRPLGRGILLSELNARTPWNTYQIDGLPPTPIANPGRAAIEAVLNPPTSDELFFVADGSGGHVFASTYPEHQRNVARWRQVERQKAAAAGAGR
ncbi:endolytic transglycosylase MltG [Phenylobacterium sp. J367]|uniref:endolytic transglycosylase MltG n=1 Tax=Phenylobacterium sp. J367 TaxID=2898435 RepID=UPI0021513A4D|nr:endolytic transglycosylase MltG [Phenylobacterium sp. J367]MCR5880534.1 endolytic transglycosylase MltG [Phenylobacterium sp. J367]